MQRLTKIDLSKFYFGAFAMTDLGGIPCFVTRTGYTGEDGFEISVPNEKAVSLTEQLMSAGGVHLAGASSSQPLLPVVAHSTDASHAAGLGARDSLRLEAGLCLYGNDLTEDITPVEAGLAWTVGAQRLHRHDAPTAALR